MTPPSSPTHVLIIDDQAEIRTLLRAGLEGLGRPDLVIEEVADGEAAWTRLRRPPRPDLILTDIVMPSMDGFELIQLCKADAQLRGLPVVVLSACTSVDDIHRALGLGAIDYLTKPFDLSQLPRRLERALELSKRLREADRVAHLEQRAMSVDAEWELVRRLEVDRAFRLQDPEDIHPLASLAIRYLPEQERQSAYLGITEMLSNAVLHGNLELGEILADEGWNSRSLALAQERLSRPPWCSRWVEMRLLLRRSRFEVRITDEGLGFDPVARTRGRALPESIHEHGHGIALTRHAFDEVTFDFQEAGGTRVRLVKSIERTEVH